MMPFLALFLSAYIKTPSHFSSSTPTPTQTFFTKNNPSLSPSKMAQVQSGQASEGIKLFGTTITLHGRERREDNKVSEDETEKRPERIIPCPRCKSMETKFCYFNNYNVNQPRHFCKGCQRYWTAGGALRNVPIGAGRRKAKPPSHDPTGFLDAGLASTVQQQFGLEERLILDEWDVATITHGDFRQFFPSKRRRINSAEHESQNEFVMRQEIIEDPNEKETKEGLKGRDNLKLI